MEQFSSTALSTLVDEAGHHTIDGHQT